MKHRLAAVAAATIALIFATTSEAAYSAPQPKGEIQTVEYIWHDAKRDRDVPVKIYYPSSGNGPFPFVIFSHGLGGSREGYDYFGNYLAGCGYVSVHLQHAGSDDSIWRGKPLTDLRDEMQSVARTPENARNRPQDVSFAIDQMIALNLHPGNPFNKRLDLYRIAVAGHSFGAWTTLTIAGEEVAGKSLADPRVKAAIAMSAPVNFPQRQNGSAFSAINIPVLHLTGTRDEGAISDTTAADRRVPFDNARRVPAFLVIFNGADHMTFARHLRPGAAASDEKLHELIAKTSVAFLDAYLRNDSGAKQWLVGDGVNQLLGDSATIEKKP
jgi:predicted dienelactone hydrolase